MSTACIPDHEARRREILDWYARTATRSHHEFLGLAAGYTTADLRAAYARLAKRFHPDAVGSWGQDLRREAEAVFLRLGEAFQALNAVASTRAGSPPRPSIPTSGPRAVRAGAEGASAPPGAVAAVSQPARPPEPGPTPSPARMAQPVVVPHGGGRRERVEEAVADATLLLSQAQIEAAIDRLHEVIRLADASQRRRVRLLLARAYLAQPRWARNAIALLNDAVSEHPNDAEALALLGTAYFQQKLPARAAAALRRALLADPGHARARAELRSVEAALSERRGAEPDAEVHHGFMGRILALGRKVG